MARKEKKPKKEKAPKAPKEPKEPKEKKDGVGILVTILTVLLVIDGVFTAAMFSYIGLLKLEEYASQPTTAQPPAAVQQATLSGRGPWVGTIQTGDIQ